MERDGRRVISVLMGSATKGQHRENEELINRYLPEATRRAHRRRVQEKVTACRRRRG